MSAPNIGVWVEEEGFTVENVGVRPDIEVELRPALVQAATLRSSSARGR